MLKNFLIRSYFASKVIANRKDEPHVSLSELLKFVFFGDLFCRLPFRRKKKFTTSDAGESYKVTYDSFEIFYSKSVFQYPNKVNRNFSAIVDEQTPDFLDVCPHRYIETSKMDPDWVIYDIGCAEGLQSLEWSKHGHVCVLFEPLPDSIRALEQTFREHINQNKVIIVPEGIGLEKQESRYFDNIIKIDSLSNLMKKYALPLPNYIKVDIEGYELDFLNGSLDVLELDSLKCMQITTYHRPSDYKEIPNILTRFNGKGYFNKGVVFYNRIADQLSSYKVLHHPIFRKCVYTYHFNNKKNSSHNLTGLQ